MVEVRAGCEGVSAEVWMRMVKREWTILRIWAVFGFQHAVFRSCRGNVHSTCGRFAFAIVRLTMLALW